MSASKEQENDSITEMTHGEEVIMARSLESIMRTDLGDLQKCDFPFTTEVSRLTR